MPTYAYACTACDHRFEMQQSFTDASLTACPECEGRLRKLFNTVGIVFKGSGFYRTDNRTGSDRSRKDAEPATEPAAARNGSASGAAKDGSGVAAGSSSPAASGSTSGTSGRTSAAPASSAA